MALVNGYAVNHSKDLSAAEWLLATDASSQHLIDFGPAAFPAYARLRCVPDPVRPGMDESDALVPADHRPDIDVARTAIRALVRYSSSVGDCCICLWEGYGGMFVDPELERGPLVTLPHRRFVLFTATIDELETGMTCSTPRSTRPRVSSGR